MNIQIFGKSKCFDTKKAERYFKERRIKVQNIDLVKYGMSPGEFRSVKSAVGGLQNMLDEKAGSMKRCTSPIWSARRTSSRRPWSTLACSRPLSCATASRPPWAIAPRCGKLGNKGRNHGRIQDQTDQ